MVFNSLSYFLFLPLVYLLFSVVQDRYRWLVLLSASYVFYGFILKPILLVALTIVILVTFRLGSLIDRSEHRSERRSLLWAGVIVNISLLIYFKYIPFIIQNLNLVIKSLGWDFVLEKPHALVSIGLSFFIFQAISYLADIYFRMAKPEQHFGYFALYLAFFPKLLQGPIERAGDLMPQLKAKYVFNYDNMRSGMLLFTWGLFKKVVIADRLGLYVDPVYNNVHSFTGLPLLLATYAYAFQIYMDFSGYTDMARGSARLFNINLTENFKNPYLSTSLAEFWRRWHISFSRWILDYIFEPLQMVFRNIGKYGTVAALVTAFVLAGIWHGASWNYVVFGLIHGIYLGASFIAKPYQKKLYKGMGIDKTRFLKLWQIFLTFNLVSFAFIFFRAGTMSDAWYITSHMFSFYDNYLNVARVGLSEFASANILIKSDPAELGIMAIVFSAVYLVQRNSVTSLLDKPTWFRWSCYYGLLLCIVFLGVASKSEFIYFQF